MFICRRCSSGGTLRSGHWSRLRRAQGPAGCTRLPVEALGREANRLSETLGAKLLPEREATAPKVVDLLAALEASVEAAKASRKRHPTSHQAEAADADAEEAAPARTRRRKSA